MDDIEMFKKIKAASIVVVGTVTAIFLPYLIGNCYTYNSPIEPFGIWMFGAVTLTAVIPLIIICYRIYLKLLK